MTLSWPSGMLGAAGAASAASPERDAHEPAAPVDDLGASTAGTGQQQQLANPVATL